MDLTDFHARLANTAMLYTLVMAVWGFWRYFRKEGVSSSYWGAVAIAELILVIQGGMGVYLWILGLRPARLIHILYGIVALITIPAAYTYTRGRDTRFEMLIQAAVNLFLFGIILRSITTG